VRYIAGLVSEIWLMLYMNAPFRSMVDLETGTVER
jgi:hypothetical protein